MTNGTTWAVFLAIFVAILGVLQLLVVGGVFGLFRKVLDFEGRLSKCEGIIEERQERLQRINSIHKGE